MNWLAVATAAALVGISWPTEAQTVYTNPACEYSVTFPDVPLEKEDQFTARTSFEAIPFLTAKCFHCPQACRYRASLEKRLLSELIAQFELKDYELKNEPEPHKGFLISGITTKENAVTRVEARVLFSENSILILSTVQPVAVDTSAAAAFLKSAARR